MGEFIHTGRQYPGEKGKIRGVLRKPLGLNIRTAVMRMFVWHCLTSQAYVLQASVNQSWIKNYFM